MNIFITGATGFIGSHLVGSLNRMGIKPYCQIRTALKNLEGLDIHQVKCKDYNDEVFRNTIKEMDHVFYLAGLTKANCYERFIKENAISFMDFYNAVIEEKANIKWFCYLSTMAVNRPREDGSPITEDDPLKPISNYGKSKAMIEMFLRTRKEFPIFTVRLPGVYGPKDKDFLEYFKMVKRGIIAIPGAADNLLSMIYVDDLIDLLLRAFERKIEGLYYISDGRHYSYREIGVHSKNLLNKKAKFVKIPDYIANIFAQMHENFKRDNVINRQKIEEMVAGNWICTNEKISKALKWEPTHDLEAGLKKTIDWYKENNML